jgi:FlaA1/EpsC-like NDP-sugar epimerase
MPGALMVEAWTKHAMTFFSRWWRERVPTRAAIVVTAFLALIFEFTYLTAFYLRAELLLKPSDAALIMRTIGWVVGLKLVVFYWRGMAHRPWRSARFEDLNQLVRATTTCLFLFVALNYFGALVPGWVPIPRSVLLLDWAFTILAVGGMQAVARSLYEEVMPNTQMGNERTVLVVDAAPAGRELALALGGLRNVTSGHSYFVAGLLDDDPDTYGLRVGRARVLGPVEQAAPLAERLRAREIVVREGAIFGSRLRALCDACAAIDVRVSIAENVTLADQPHAGAGPAHRLKRHTVLPMRVRDIELPDLLTRPQARLSDHDAHVVPFLHGKTVLVTGAGGSIGSEICRQLMRFEPARLLLVERSECALFAIHRELAEAAVDSGTDHVTQLHAILCDIGNAERTERMLAEFKPQVVFHAAAFKHVPLMEAHPVEAIENNTLATVTLAELAEAQGVETFVALSTDKAVHPSSTMGATKLVAERFLQSFGEQSATKFVAVRFGNVLGSSGSAVPIFEEQLRRRHPLSITHPEVRRYFMTINEAAQLVLLAGALPGRGGTFVLEMGRPIRIVDLVGNLAFVMHVPQEEVRIEFVGLRPGEKLDEELFFEDELREPTANPLVIRARRAARPLDDVRQWLGELKAAVADSPDAAYHSIMDIVAADCSSLEPVAHVAPAGQQLAEPRA